MRRFNALVFDDIVVAGTDAMTSTAYDGSLGQFDNLSLHVVIDNATASGTLSIYADHSGNGQNWTRKFAGASVVSATVTTGATTTKTGAEPIGGELSMAFVRLTIRLFTTGTARVRVYATARDGGA